MNASRRPTYSLEIPTRNVHKASWLNQKLQNQNNDELIFLPLGGVGEIGMNFALYGYGKGENRRWIVVDCGVTFPGDDLPGADLVLPDISYIVERRDKLDGIVITHAHEDHYGALLSLWPMINVPVHCTPFTAAMLEAKIRGEPGAPKIPVEVFRAGDTFKVGPFEIEAVHVTHSLPEPVSLMLRSPAGNIVHTGDWKLDHEPTLGKQTDEAHFRKLGDEGVLALICDSTNAMREGVSPSEESVSEEPRRYHQIGKRQGADHDLLLQCRTHPFHRHGGATVETAGHDTGAFFVEGLRSVTRAWLSRRHRAVSVGGRVQKRPAQQTGGHLYRLAG